MGKTNFYSQESSVAELSNGIAKVSYTSFTSTDNSFIVHSLSGFNYSLIVK